MPAEPTQPPARMLPERSRALWVSGGDGQLLIEHCEQCEHWVHPPLGECPDCGGPLVARPVSGRGTVFTFTANFHRFNPQVPIPYVIAIVELVEQSGLYLATNIIDCEPDSVVCGMPVEVRFERHGTGPDSAFVPVFAPTKGGSGNPAPAAGG